MLQNTISHNGKPKYDKGNSKTPVWEYSQRTWVQPAPTLLWFFWMHLGNFLTTKYSRSDDEMRFLLWNPVFWRERGKKKKLILVSCRSYRQRPNYRAKSTNQAVRCPYSFPSCTLCPSTGLIWCLSTQKNNVYEQTTVKLTQSKAIFPLMSHLWTFRSPRQTKHPSLRSIDWLKWSIALHLFICTSWLILDFFLPVSL